MKKNYTKPLNFRLVIALILIGAIIVIHSCKKDTQEQSPSKSNTLTDPVIDQARKWYDSVYKAVTNNSTLATQSVGQKPSHNWSKRFFPDWMHAKTYTMYGNTCIEMPAIQVGNMAICFSKPKDSTKFDFSRSGSKTSLLIVKVQNTMNMYAMTIVADSSYLQGNYDKLANNTYQKIDTNFTGTIFFNQMDGTFVNGWIYKSGIITRQLSPSTAYSGQVIQSVNDGKLHVDEEIPPGCGAIVSVTVYEDCYDDLCFITSDVGVEADCPPSNGGGAGGGSGGTGGGGGTSPCTVPPANSSVQSVAINSSSSRGFTVNVAMPPPGGGTTPCSTTTPPKITDSVKNPCLHAMVEATISANVKNQINSLIQSVFGGSTTMNLTFIDTNTLPANADGYTNTQGGIVNGSLNVEILLDNNHLPNYSQQYIARVIMHEALHAYLTSKGTSEDQQHETIMVNYVTKMATSLQQMFPGLSTSDAQNLALGGLQVSQTFHDTIENDMKLSGSFVATNLAYSVGPSGLRCNF